MKDLIEKIKKLRKDKNMTLKDVSEKLNMSLTAYNQIELGNTALSLERVYQFADIFSVSVAELLDIETNNVIVPVDNGKEVEELKKEVEQLNDKLELLSSFNTQLLDNIYKKIGENLEVWKAENFEMNEKKTLVLKPEYAQKIENILFDVDIIFYYFDKKLIDNIHFQKMFEAYKKRKRDNEK